MMREECFVRTGGAEEQGQQGSINSNPQHLSPITITPDFALGKNQPTWVEGTWREREKSWN